MFLHGHGVAQDKQKAIDLFKGASNKHYAYGQYRLAMFLSNQEKASLYREASEQGHNCAQYNLGINLEEGDGITKDLVQTARRYRCAAELGHQIATQKLTQSTDTFMQYHAHMLNAKEQEAYELIVNNKDLIEELLFDLTREFVPENVRESAVNILNKLLETHPNNQEYQRAETAYYMTEIMRRFDESKFYTEEYSKDSIRKIGDLLKKINIEYIRVC